ncbi:hypothetical protein D3C85_1342490 [compost metagenome]
MAFQTQPSIPINKTFLGLAAKALLANDCSSEICFSFKAPSPAFLQEIMDKTDRKMRDGKSFNVFIIK